MEITKTNLPKKHWLDVWHVNPAVNRNYDFIDGLRGVAILMVLVCHSVYINPKSGPGIHFIASIFGACSSGVSIFFALSGFLISWPFWKRKFTQSAQIVPPGYGWRRFWKIYPPLALSILGLTPIYVYLNQDWSYCATAAKWLVGVPFLLPVNGKLNSVMWTLVIEVQFYAVLPLLFVSLKRVSPKACLWIITLIFLLVPVSVRAITGCSATYLPEINTHFPSALDSFGFGIWVAGLENMGVLKKSWARLGIMGIVLWPLLLLACAWVNLHPASKNFAMTESLGWLEKIAAGCLLFYVANPQHRIARLLCTPWLRWCGIISYEWYLIHQPIVLWARVIFGPAGGVAYKYAAIVGGASLVSLTIAALTYRYFSLPILKYGRVSAVKK